MDGMTGRNNFEEQEYWVYQQQRFEAALRIFLSIDNLYSDKDNMRTAIRKADELLAKLEETRTKLCSS